jgi:hypothetical protein
MSGPITARKTVEVEQENLALRRFILKGKK